MKTNDVILQTTTKVVFFMIFLFPSISSSPAITHPAEGLSVDC